MIKIHNSCKLPEEKKLRFGKAIFNPECISIRSDDGAFEIRSTRDFFPVVTKDETMDVSLSKAFLMHKSCKLAYADDKDDNQMLVAVAIHIPKHAIISDFNVYGGKVLVEEMVEDKSTGCGVFYVLMQYDYPHSYCLLNLSFYTGSASRKGNIIATWDELFMSVNKTKLKKLRGRLYANYKKKTFHGEAHYTNLRIEVAEKIKAEYAKIIQSKYNFDMFAANLKSLIRNHKDEGCDIESTFKETYCIIGNKAFYYTPEDYKQALIRINMLVRTYNAKATA